MGPVGHLDDQLSEETAVGGAGDAKTTGQPTGYLRELFTELSNERSRPTT